MNNKEINREAIRLSRTIETQKAEKLFRYNATHYPCALTINNLAWFLYLEYSDYDANVLIQMFKKAYSLCPNPKSLTAIAQLYFDKGELLNVEKYLEAADRFCENKMVKYNMGVVKYRLGKYKEAKNCFKRGYPNNNEEITINAMEGVIACEIKLKNNLIAKYKIFNLLKCFDILDLGYTPLGFAYMLKNYKFVYNMIEKRNDLLRLWVLTRDDLFVIINSYAKLQKNFIYYHKDYIKRFLTGYPPIKNPEKEKYFLRTASSKQNNLRYKTGFPYELSDCYLVD